MPVRHQMVVSVHLFLVKKDLILLLKRHNTGYEDGNYSVPAGHIDKNESPTQAMIREAKEETELNLKKENLTIAHVMHRIEDREQIDFFFVCKAWTGKPTNTEPDKCSEIAWFPINNLPTNTIPYIKLALKNYQENIIFSEFTL